MAETRIQKFDRRLAPLRDKGMTVPCAVVVAARDIRRERRARGGDK